MRAASLAILAALLAAGCSAPGASDALHTAGSGGGSVTDTPATFQAFAISQSAFENDGTGTLLVNGTVFDSNAESDVSYLRPFLNGSVTLASNHTVTSAERAATSEPTTWPADNVRVWTGASATDGKLFFRWRLAITSGFQPGFYLVGASATNPNGVTGYLAAPLSLNVTNASQVTIAALPVDAAGVPQSGSWGAWNASPGSTNAASANYLKLTNVGSLSRPRILVDFNELAFTGTSDAAYTVPINDNVQFAWWEDATPASSAPSEGTYSFVTAPQGSVQVSFSARGDVIYVAYRLASLPATLASQTYSATFTATDVGGDDGANAKPDLVIDSFATTPAQPIDGQDVSLQATIRNVGTAAFTGTTTVTISTGGTTIATLSYAGPIAIGATATATAPPMQATAGTFVVATTVDPSGTTPETVETNNARSFTVVVASSGHGK